MGRSLQQSGSYVAPCDPGTQRMALMVLYNNTLGGAWANHSGWLDLSPAQMATPASLALSLAAVPVSSGTCLSSNGSSVLPDYCCWYGVECCTPQTCVNAVPSSCTSCFCEPGLVISLGLSANMVGWFPSTHSSASRIPYCRTGTHWILYRYTPSNIAFAASHVRLFLLMLVARLPCITVDWKQLLSRHRGRRL